MRAELKSSGGFTLIEVLAALIIVSLGMLGVITAVSQTASNTAYLRDKSIAHWVAMNKLAEVRIQRNAPKIDKTSDEVEMAGRRWRWTMEVEQTPVESVRRIDITVRQAEAKEDTSMASVSGFYGAAVAPPGTIDYLWEGTQQGGRGRQPGGGEGEGEGDASPTPSEQPQPQPEEPAEPIEDPEPEPEPPEDRGQ